MNGDADLGPSIKSPLVQALDRPEPPDDLIFYTAEQVAHLLELNVETVKVWLREGEIRAFKPGGRWRISQRDLRAWTTARYGS
jgi:excisionase family DNA binding protein